MIEELADNTATRRRCCPTASASAIASSPSARTAIRAGRWAESRQGRGRLPADAEPAGIHGDLARHHARRRRRGAAQHQSDRPLARPLHRHRRRPSTSSSRPSCSSRSDTARPLLQEQRRRSGCTATAQPKYPRIDRAIEALSGGRLAAARAPPAHHRGPRALHLHVRHHRPAQGRQHQPLPRDARLLWLRRRDGHARDRPHVRLPADVSHRRRPLRDRLAAGQRRLGRACASASRRASSGTTSCATTARCSNISASCAAIWSIRRRTRTKPSTASARLRQRPAARHLGRIQEALPDPADPRVLRRDRRQRDDVQFRGQAAARSAACPGSSSTASRPRWCASTSRRSSRCATRTASASLRRRTRSARRSARSSTTRTSPAAASRAMRSARKPRRRSCATCSSRATPGSAPAT